MDIDHTEAEDQYRVWLSPREYDALVEHAYDRSLQHGVVVRLGGECGLRSFEVPQIRPIDVLDDKTAENNQYFLHIREGKDTTGNGGKPRDTWLPTSLERDLLELRYDNDVEPDEPIIDVTRRRVQRIVKEAAEEVAQSVEDGESIPGQPEQWRMVSSHDLRRYFAHNLLVRERVNPRVVMAIGGWDGWDSIEPYLREATPEVIADELEGTSLGGGHA